MREPRTNRHTLTDYSSLVPRPLLKFDSTKVLRGSAVTLHHALKLEDHLILFVIDYSAYSQLASIIGGRFHPERPAVETKDLLNYWAYGPPNIFSKAKSGRI
jgi:hypothetical protein